MLSPGGRWRPPTLGGEWRWLGCLYRQSPGTMTIAAHYRTTATEQFILALPAVAWHCGAEASRRNVQAESPNISPSGSWDGAWSFAVRVTSNQRRASRDPRRPESRGMKGCQMPVVKRRRLPVGEIIATAAGLHPNQRSSCAVRQQPTLGNGTWSAPALEVAADWFNEC